MGSVRFSNGQRRRKLEAVLLLVCLCGLISLSCAGRPSASRQKLQVQKHLNRLNKPPIKTIESPDGDIIDCVHISHQPAFDHPFLKDHKIQMRPSYHPEGLFDENKISAKPKERTNPITQLWHMNGKCPEDTIPIRRTKKEDVLRASSVKRYGKKKHRSIPKPRSADPDLINQKVIRLVLGGSFGEDLNSIEAGWQVSPDLYGDNNTRLFTYWTSDAYQATGCYNLLCSGFIQVNSEIAMGASISPVSAFRNSQYDISILVWKDPKEGNWWMQFGSDYVLGYWPSFLFSYLADSASMIEWGGEVVNSEPDGQHTSTQMGSGHFPEEGFGKSSYFRNIQVVDSSNNLKAPKELGTFAEQSNCYDVQTGSNGDWGHYFYYGGPGRNPNCQ
ncbi:UNVERIFIED_CONTAM: hypothetical protein Sradi_0383100 [Sesamum radiatum]|uniref:Neprosin PEP catalytic domain-containing protein n=1 Tax=Sesamum radiatum TaxID=300843 RepID=A0AAW2W4E1_SESRA